MLLHEKIRKWREDKGLKQEGVAQQLGITQPAYSDIENSKTKITNAHKKKLSVILEVPLEKFKDDDGSDEMKVELLQKESEFKETIIIELRKEIIYLKKIIELLGGKWE